MHLICINAVCQVNTYQMQIWVPGNCAAIRLGTQLASDAVVLKLDSPEFELKTFNDTFTVVVAACSHVQPSYVATSVHPDCSGCILPSVVRLLHVERFRKLKRFLMHACAVRACVMHCVTLRYMQSAAGLCIARCHSLTAVVCEPTTC